MTHEENFNQDSDLVKINDSSQNYPIIIYARQLNQYYHTLLGNPFQRLNYYDSFTGQYCFYRTPGIINYIITYYLQQGCLLTEVHYPPEILYDELVFFGFNIQIIYDIVSNCITINYYIPSGNIALLFYKFDTLLLHTNMQNRSPNKLKQRSIQVVAHIILNSIICKLHYEAYKILLLINLEFLIVAEKSVSIDH
ncbi:unnamed protein product [Rotaria socialis]|uniref:Potassium channel tetramerisation-type BTB domain-containing protein n=1 Tax=Rotaria socialis TaxID=392032 RepID=A0A818I0Z4_9BILA|nr:unnamed protein product [Rotaria socialis]